MKRPHHLEILSDNPTSHCTPQMHILNRLQSLFKDSGSFSESLKGTKYKRHINCDEMENKWQIYGFGLCLKIYRHHC